jgi:hypothetical protein
MSMNSRKSEYLYTTTPSSGHGTGPAAQVVVPQPLEARAHGPHRPPKTGLEVHWLAVRDIAAGEETTFNYGPQDSDELDNVDAAEHADVNLWPPAAAGAPHPAERRSKRARRAPEGM